MNGAWFLYLDESGDLGFDPTKKGRSNYFTICLLAIRTPTRNKTVSLAIQKTLRRKVNNRRNRRKIAKELKGTNTTLEVKRYFFGQVTGVLFGIYALTLIKSRLYERLQEHTARTYNYLSRLLLEQLPFEAADTSVDLYIDKSKNQPQIVEFNSYIERELNSRMDPGVLFNIHHKKSDENYCLQAVDLFCWGVHRMYEYNDSDWFNTFKGKVRYESLFPK